MGYAGGLNSLVLRFHAPNTSDNSFYFGAGHTGIFLPEVFEDIFYGVLVVFVRPHDDLL